MSTRGRLLRGLLARHRRAGLEAERGTTMVEVLVGMTIMVICGAIFTGAVVNLNRTSNQAQAITNAASQNNQAYQTLERTVRYVSAISPPGRSNGRWYVELSDTTSGSEVCTQLRVAGEQLQSRSWTVATPATPATPSAWLPLASGVRNGGAAAGTPDQPFVVPVRATTSSPTTGPTPTSQPTQAAGLNRQQLTVTLVVRAGPTAQPVSSRSSYTLTALNSTVPPPTGAICAQVSRS